MNTPYLGPALGLCILVSAICRGEVSPQPASQKDAIIPPPADHTETTKTDESKKPPEPSAEPAKADDPDGHQFDALKETLSLERIRSTKVETLNEERRSIVASIAKDRGIKESEVLAKFYQKWPQTSSILGRAYLKSPEIAVDSFLRGLSGRDQTIALTSYASSLSRNDDVGGVRRMYELVPLGKDRAQIASKLVQATERIKGIEAALDTLVRLEDPKEKTAALMGLCANIATVKKSPSDEDLNRIYAVARTMGYEQSARSMIAPHLGPK